MKNIIIFTLLLPIYSICVVNAQTTHTINTGSYYYTPSSLTVDVGDSVIWINDGGFHDVNGDINTITNQSFNNPVTFDSPATSTVGAVIFAYKFTVPGNYNYDCSVGSHASQGMVGSVIVNVPIQSPCVPDAIYSDSTWGIWPDSTENFVSGDSGTYYEQIVNFKLPTDAGDLDPIYSGYDIDSVSLASVDGIPPGISFSCNTSNCSWLGGEQGCATISGIPTANGTYPINLLIKGCVTFSIIPGTPGLVICDTAEFTNYVIQIGPVTTVGIETSELTNSSLKLKKAFPNPSNLSTNIQYETIKSENVSFEMTNLLGESIINSNIISKIGLNSILVNTSDLSNGIYLYSISNGKTRSTKRLIVNH